jgi:hypothetical protein
MTTKFMQIGEFIEAHTGGDEIPDLLRDAAKCLDAGNLGSACWRLADAGLLLRRRMGRKGYFRAEGLDLPTGRGALLTIVLTVNEPKVEEQK